MEVQARQLLEGAQQARACGQTTDVQALMDAWHQLGAEGLGDGQLAQGLFGFITSKKPGSGKKMVGSLAALASKPNPVASPVQTRGMKRGRGHEKGGAGKA